MMKTQIISTELIKPSSPTPPQLRHHKLSFFDQRIPHSYIPFIVYYSFDDKISPTKQTEMASKLRSSLPHALTKFYPLAGRMEGENLVDCNDDGIHYAEARVHLRLSDIIESPEAEALEQLIPFKIDGNELTRAEPLAVQVNLFGCGGIAIGFCISHRIADGWSLITFIKSWAATARGEPDSVSPNLNLASLFPPRDSLGYKPEPVVPKERFPFRRFVFTAEAIAALRAKAVGLVSSSPHPTRVELVSALIWKCSIGNNSISLASHPVNLRPRMQPTLPENSFGNLFQMAIAEADGEADLVTLIQNLRAAIGKIDSDYGRRLVGEEGFEVAGNNLRGMKKLFAREEATFLRFSSFCGFPFREADFGWGKPIWGSTGYGGKNLIFLVDSRFEGGIEAWVSMNEEDMAKFEHHPELQVFFVFGPQDSKLGHLPIITTLRDSIHLYKADKHGTCSESILDHHRYFEAALKIKHRVDLLKILQDAGIHPDGKFYSLEAIKDALKGGSGYVPGVECNRDASGNYQLFQIYLCVDTSGSDLIDCPVVLKRKCNSTIEFPPF